ncbi:hypothetical protein [Anaerosacchariphilus polymeriproducens]
MESFFREAYSVLKPNGRLIILNITRCNFHIWILNHVFFQG